MEQVKELLDKRDVLDKINEYLNQFNQVDQYEICNAIGYLYEEIRRLPTHSSLNGHYVEQCKTMLYTADTA